MQTHQSYLNKAQQDKFLLVFDVPPILKGISAPYVRDNNHIDPNSVQFSIFGSIIPEITVKGVETRYAGSTLYVSSHSRDSYPPVNVKFTVDSMYNNYWTIYSWLNLLHDDTNGTYNAKGLEVDKNFNDYMTNLTIYGLDEFKKKRIKFDYIKCFPISLDTLTYDQKGEEGQEIESGFTFVFSQLHTTIVRE